MGIWDTQTIPVHEFKEAITLESIKTPVDRYSFQEAYEGTLRAYKLLSKDSLTIKYRLYVDVINIKIFEREKYYVAQSKIKYLLINSATREKVFNKVIVAEVKDYKNSPDGPAVGELPVLAMGALLLLGGTPGTWRNALTGESDDDELTRTITEKSVRNSLHEFVLNFVENKKSERISPY